MILLEFASAKLLFEEQYCKGLSSTEHTSFVTMMTKISINVYKNGIKTLQRFAGRCVATFKE